MLFRESWVKDASVMLKTIHVSEDKAAAKEKAEQFREKVEVKGCGPKG